ncbi:Uncharacterized protein OnM2_098015 [Erysiphe neolycopersici]|uniref:Copper acquisition factor BIM1-like domain-containing protein n=1 Tax=Erysiphe neolycopersici TaxID=212602 RepID=A0A420HA58_9PEZI|nr:Uncharacterized protein OnM2_098015 [Erysiphe neolycopersici]
MRSFFSLTNFVSTLLVLTTSSLAHFAVEYPAPRGYNEETTNQFPCGGLNEVSTQRTLYPITGGAIGIEVGHARTNIEVLIAFESEPTTKFKTILRKTFTQMGTGKFCMTNVNMPVELDIHEGTNATIQVITNSDDDGIGGYYSCSDITFGISAFDFDICQNSTGVSVSSIKVKGNANETNPGDDSSQKSAAIHNWNSDLYSLSIILLSSLITAVIIINF